MPSNILLLVVILAGYLFVHACDRFHYRAKVLEGHRLLIEASLAGLLLFGVARLFIAEPLKWMDTRYWSGWLQAHWTVLTASTPFAGTLLVTVGIAPIVATVWNLVQGFRERKLHPDEWAGRPMWANCRDFSKAMALEDALDETGNELMILLHEVATLAAAEQVMVGIAMKDRKLYIGWPSRSPRLTEHETYIALFPVMSGFRDPVNLKTTFNFFYPLHDVEFPPDDVFQDPYRHVVIIPVAEIQSARLLPRDFQPEELGVSSLANPPSVSPTPPAMGHDEAR
jgi:hypothetical protein